MRPLRIALIYLPLMLATLVGWLAALLDHGMESLTGALVDWADF
jgi:hypothetical protein